MKYRITKDAEYVHQNKRGGRPKRIKIPAGSVGELVDGMLVFYQFSHGGHNPYVFLTSVYDFVEVVI